MLHANYFALDGPSSKEIVNTPMDASLRIVMQTICIAAVNIFVMISGWFGIKPTKRSFLNLVFQVFFYLILVYIIFLTIGKTSFSLENIKHITLATSSNWFIKAYVLLYLLSPILNYYVDNASRSEFRFILVAFFIFQTIYGWAFPKATDYFVGGYSVVSFIGLYLLARYLKVYSVADTINWRYVILICLGIIVCVFALCILPSFLGYGMYTIYTYNFLTYTSPTTIAISTLTILGVSKLKIQSQLVNRLALSSFAVYLVYVSPWILHPYGLFFKNLHSQIQGLAYWGITLCIVCILYLVVACIDTLRLKVWKSICKCFAD